MTAYLSDLPAQLRLFFARLDGTVSTANLRVLSQPTARFAPDPSLAQSAPQPGDVLLVNSRISATIKFPTQST